MIPISLPLGEDVLNGLQFGGKRNYGYGTTRLRDTQVVDLEELDQSGLEDAKSHILKLVTPFVLRSEYPATNAMTCRGGGAWMTHLNSASD